ncbi:hypothetical protein [Alteromonas stellipolaris]|uniref:hypothetical protein n=1 Tax=Alteromonas stellipolaris TaxID=233316 RepID=UPI0026E19A01|nr:hypothetical protein [Alteromonas stellipolaris]MDO6534825.1 hypothetical protein [Alteromonas stellipolaris]MDO6626702.1 hypothetical protein [Alteromonas stellipolaris]
MFVFKLKVGSTDFYKLEENLFTRITGKKFPYYVEYKDSVKHHAVCPACDNPLLIINLHVDREYEDESGESKQAPLHARHIKYDVADLATYDEEAYIECPYANPSSSISPTKKKPGKASNEILQLIRIFPDAIALVLSKSLGIFIEEGLFDSMLKTFKKEEGYLFRFVNKYNLPYSFAYMADRQDLWRQKIDIRYSDTGKEIASAIKNNSRWTWVNDKGYIVRKQGITPLVKTEFYFTDIVVAEKNGIKTLQFDFLIEQTCDGEQDEVFRKTIPFDDFYYYNLINKRTRFLDIVRRNEV